tara:strand:+ start:1291 stop:1482 length:192 start_codon:yes stop_codon:yes gene_type:complete
MNNSDKLEQQLREAVEYIESMQESIEASVSEAAGEWIYQGMNNQLYFDLKKAKELLFQLEGES